MFKKNTHTFALPVPRKHRSDIYHLRLLNN